MWQRQLHCKSPPSRDSDHPSNAARAKKLASEKKPIKAKQLLADVDALLAEYGDPLSSRPDVKERVKALSLDFKKTGGPKSRLQSDTRRLNVREKAVCTDLLGTYVL